MLVKKKCTNLDCRDYDIEYAVQIVSAIPSYLYCPTCYLGKLDICVEKEPLVLINPSQEELIVAEFDIRKIIQR